MLEFVHQPNNPRRAGDFLQAQLREDKWDQFRAAVAFVKHSGVRHLRTLLAEFSRRADVKLSVGVDHGGTSMEGLRGLMESIEDRGEIWVYHNENHSTFHPKIYLFKNDHEAQVLIGSGNLTGGGLFTNYEASLLLSLDLENASDQSLLTNIETTLDEWADVGESKGLSQLLTPESLAQLVATGYAPTEESTTETEESDTRSSREVTGARGTPLFAAVSVPAAPTPPREEGEEPEPAEEEEVEIEIPPPAPAPGGNHTGFLMTLQRTDVGRGQITAGTSARSPEIFIPLRASRDYDPEFWGFPDEFTEEIPGWTGRRDAEGRGGLNRNGVKVRLGGEIIEVSLFYNPHNEEGDGITRETQRPLRPVHGVGPR